MVIHLIYADLLPCLLTFLTLSHHQKTVLEESHGTRSSSTYSEHFIRPIQKQFKVTMSEALNVKDTSSTESNNNNGKDALIHMASFTQSDIA